MSTLTTGTDGKLKIEGLAWGDYELRETKAPSGFKTSDEPLRFTIGRNNCMTMQKYTMTNEPATAKLNITKYIDQLNRAAWGNPTFIFNLKQTHYYDSNGELKELETPRERKFSITFDTDDRSSGDEDYPYFKKTGEIEVEPGTYEITEIPVSRYQLKAVTVNGEAQTESLSATVTVQANNPTTEVAFKNKLEDSSKFSHVSAAVNRFDGVKAIEVSYDPAVTLNEAIAKKNLTAYWIMSSGERKEMTDDEKNALELASAVEGINVTNNGTTFTITGTSAVTADNVFTLRATDSTGFSDTFEVHFTPDALLNPREVRVTFKNDTGNKSRLTNGTTVCTVCTYSFLIVGTGDSAKILKIFKDGQAQDVSSWSPPSVTVNEMYSDKQEFKEWSYSGGSQTTGTAADKDGLLTMLKALPADAHEVTVTAVLKAKST